MTKWSARTTYQGKSINQGTNQIMAALNKMVRTREFGGETSNVSMAQGGYNRGGVAASAGTHDGGGAFDLSEHNWANRVRALRILGCAAWHRPKNWDNRGGSGHLHSIVVGDGTASAGAKSQVVAYLAGKNGLANNAKDADKRPKVLPILFHLDGDLSPRYARVACHVYAEPNTSATNLGVVAVGESFVPVAVVNVDGHYWFVTAEGACGYDDNFTTVAPVCETPAPMEPVEPTPDPDPAPAPDPEPVPSDETTLTIAYWNVGPLAYSNLTAADRVQITKVVAGLKAARCSLAVLMEMHEENGTKGALGYFKSIMPPDWAVLEGDGGTHLVSMGGKYDLIQTRNYISRKRAFTMWNLRRTSTGLPFWVHALHTTAGMKPTNILDRNTQAKDLVAKVGHIARGITAVDKNNYTASLGSPTKRFKDAGLVSMYDAVTVPGSELNSHHDYDSKGNRVAKGRHIDFLGAHRLVKVKSAKQVNTTGVGCDHDLLVATVTIEGTTP